MGTRSSKARCVLCSWILGALIKVDHTPYALPQQGVKSLPLLPSHAFHMTSRNLISLRSLSTTAGETSQTAPKKHPKINKWESEVIAEHNGRNITILENQARKTIWHALVPLSQRSNTMSSTRAELLQKYLQVIHCPVLCKHSLRWSNTTQTSHVDIPQV